MQEHVLSAESYELPIRLGNIPELDFQDCPTLQGGNDSVFLVFNGQICRFVLITVVD